MNEKISDELNALAQNDLVTRQRLIEEKVLFNGYHPEMEKVHIFNTRRLNEIIEKIGYPTISKVGKIASDAAWLIIQHSIGNPQFIRNCYELIKDSADVNPQNIAYLYDRIKYFEGKPQKFGTQLNSDGSIYQVENKEILNELRARFNFPILPEEQIQKIENPDFHSDYHQNSQDFTVWRKKTGWI